MRGGHHKVARAYVLYREEHARARASAAPAPSSDLHVADADGTRRPLDWARVEHVVGEAVAGIDDVSAEPVLAETRRNALRRHLRRRAGAGAGHGRAHAGGDASRTTPPSPPGCCSTRCAPRRCATWPATRGSPARPRWPRATPTTSATTSRTRVELELVDPELAALRPRQGHRRDPARARPRLHLPRPADPLRPLLPARATASGSSCRRRSSCASRWGWRSARSTARTARSSSTSCCPRSTSWPRRRRCSTPAPPARSCRRAS